MTATLLAVDKRPAGLRQNPAYRSTNAIFHADGAILLVGRNKDAGHAGTTQTPRLEYSEKSLRSTVCVRHSGFRNVCSLRPARRRNFKLFSSGVILACSLRTGTNAWFALRQVLNPYMQLRIRLNLLITPFHHIVCASPTIGVC